jgi:UDP-N-acetylmuramate dehydrogenase
MTIQNDALLSEVLWYKIGGRAKYLLTVEKREDIEKALEFIAKEKPKRIFVCGQGSNLIFSADYFDGAIIQIVASKPDVSISDNHVIAFGGTILGDVIAVSFDHSLTGLEWAGGLPGTVGAGVRGNVGAYGGEIKDSLISAEVIDFSEGKFVYKKLTNEQLHFVYRGSIIKINKKMLVVSATFALKKSTPEEVAAAREVCERNKQNRRDKHPLEYPNCGSVFKNLRDKEQIARVLHIYPDLRESVEKKWYGKVAVASLIEKLGLKGLQIGNAQISEKHALFIINKGNAKAKDVLAIIGRVKKECKNRFGFEPEVEVEIVD